MDKARRRRLILTAGAGTAGAGMTGGYWWWRCKRASGPLPPDPAFPNALPLPAADGIYGFPDPQATTAILARRARYPLLDGKIANLRRGWPRQNATRFSRNGDLPLAPTLCAIRGL